MVHKTEALMLGATGCCCASVVCLQQLNPTLVRGKARCWLCAERRMDLPFTSLLATRTHVAQVPPQRQSDKIPTTHLLHADTLESSVAERRVDYRPSLVRRAACAAAPGSARCQGVLRKKSITVKGACHSKMRTLSWA